MDDETECCGCGGCKAPAVDEKAVEALHRHEAGLEAVRALLSAIGEDPDRPGLRDTPERVMKAWATTWGRGYAAETADLLKLFELERELDPGEVPPMVTVRQIHFYSTCEHHLAPFFGTASVAYIPHGRLSSEKIAEINRLTSTQARMHPSGIAPGISQWDAMTRAEQDAMKRGTPKVVGISKLARVVDHFSRRLQVQERLTQEVAGFLAQHLSPHVAVRMVARHMCMMSRGVQQHDSETITMALRGEFVKPEVRQEFLHHAGA